MVNKIALSVLLVLVLVLVALGVVRFTGKGFHPQSEAEVATSTYSNAALGFSFKYPDSYALQERDITINKAQVHIITLTQKGVVIPENNDGSTAITLSVFTVGKEASLPAWLQTTVETGGSFDYQKGTLGSEPALVYTATGLYESDNIAAMHGGHGYILSSTWSSREDHILKDFNSLLSTVTFSN